MTAWRLVADVGGTNVRFARGGPGGSIADLVEWRTGGFASFPAALDAYLDQLGEDTSGYADACIGAAGPVADDEICLTNGRWVIRRAEVSQRLGGVSVRLFNDLQAVALSLPVLGPGDVAVVLAGSNGALPDAPKLAVNVGTGFGAASLVAAPGGWISVASEAGHIALSATSPAELELCRSLKPRLGSIEDVLSGPGLRRLHRHFSRGGKSPRHIFETTGSDDAARQAVAMFTALLGRACGDLVLASAAWGGLNLFGSVLQAWHGHADMAAFRRHFTAKGKMSGRMKAVPVRLVTNQAAPLVGLAAL